MRCWYAPQQGMAPEPEMRLAEPDGGRAAPRETTPTSDRIEIQGARYPDALEEQTNL
jgi:hypothetical protein